MSKHQDRQVAHLAGALSHAIKESGVTRQVFEQRMGLSRGYLSKILGGGIELRVQHIFEILKVLEMDPGEFFRAAYPPESVAAEGSRVEAIQEYAETTPGARRISPDTDLDRRVREALARILFGDRI